MLKLGEKGTILQRDIFRLRIEPAIITRGEINLILDSLLDVWFRASDGHAA